MPEIRLVGTRLSPFVEKVASAAEYKGLSFELEERASLLEVARRNRVTRAAAQRQLEDGSDESFYWYSMASRFAPANVARSGAQLLEFVPPFARLDDLVLLLGNRTFFYSSRPTIADLALYGQSKTGCSGPTPDFERLVSERRTRADWVKRVADTTRH